MAKTRLDVIQMALRRLGVIAADQAATADQEAFAGDTLDALFEEIKGTQGVTITWALSATPDAAFLPLSYLLAAEIAPHYMVQAEPRSRAMGRLRAALISDDREDRRDLDDDGTVTDAEIAADQRAQFY